MSPPDMAPPAWFRCVDGYQFRGVRHAWHYGPWKRGRRVAVCGVELSVVDLRGETWNGRLCPTCEAAERLLAPWLEGMGERWMALLGEAAGHLRDIREAPRGDRQRLIDGSRELAGRIESFLAAVDAGR